MTEKQLDAYNRLLKTDRRITMIGHIEAVLGYDFETVMSKNGGDERSQQMAFISSMVHDMSTSKEIGTWLDTLSGVTDATEEQKALIRVWKKSYDDNVLIPTKLVQDITEAANTCQNKWFTARQDGDYKTFMPYLERLIDLTKESASITARGRSLYDTLLDRNDCGFNSEQISKLFDGMQKTILDVVSQVEASGKQATEEEEV